MQCWSGFYLDIFRNLKVCSIFVAVVVANAQSHNRNRTMNKRSSLKTTSFREIKMWKMICIVRIDFVWVLMWNIVPQARRQSTMIQNIIECTYWLMRNLKNESHIHNKVKDALRAGNNRAHAIGYHHHCNLR